MGQLTKEEAISFAEKKLYEDWTSREIVVFQLSQKLMTMPYSVFHRALEDVLNRDIILEEHLNSHDLLKEFLGEKEPPTSIELLGMIVDNVSS